MRRLLVLQECKSNPSLLAACTALSLVACTTELTVSRLTQTTTTPISGFTYVLPFTQFEVAVTRALDGDDPGGCVETGDKVAIQFSYAVAPPTVANIPDPSHTYQIDYRTLASGWKISDLKLGNFSNGMLQTINASAEDRTGQIAANVVSALGSIGLSIASGGVVAPAADAVKGKPPPQVKLQCAKEAAAAFKAQKGFDDALKAATRALDQETATLKILTGAASQMGSRLDPGVQSQLLAQANKVVDATGKLNKATRDAANNQKKFTEVTTFRFPLNGDVDASQMQQLLIPGARAAYDKWVVCTVGGKPTTCPEPGPDFSAVFLRLQPLRAANVLPPVPTTEPAGIRYRVPAQGQLALCMSPLSSGSTFHQKDPPPLCSAKPSDNWLPAASTSIWEGPVAQLGRIQYLPYSNGPFENNLLSATFNQDGSILNAEFQAKSSSVESATAAMAQVAAATGKAIASIQNAPTAKATAETAKLKAQSDLLAAQANQTVAEQIALATANKNLLDALAAQANSQAALNKAQAALNAPPAPLP